MGERLRSNQSNEARNARRRVLYRARESRQLTESFDNTLNQIAQEIVGGKSLDDPSLEAPISNLHRLNRRHIRLAGHSLLEIFNEDF